MGVRFDCILGTLLCATIALAAEIPQPDDAPKPLSPEASAKLITLPPGLRFERIASEPLIQEPSGVAFDEEGRLFVTELHGYNLEGQYDIEELNKSGQLDREVRRIQANDDAKKKAERGTYGTVKCLHDTDGDGRMDKCDIWADRLPPCYGLCPARGGVIVACAPDIVYLADRDRDGKAEIREVLFTGFAYGALERGLNAPQWGIDDWIYVGGGHGGGTITGPHLKKPVDLPNSDFRIRADGSAIEPVVGKTGTFGFAFTPAGERIIISTRTAGIFVAPIDERYLARNPDLAAGGLERNGTSDARVYPTSRPHPWRTRRAEDPGFSKFYSDRYGTQESAPNGFFTSACSPLVYQDRAIPDLFGQLFACEPAQNLVHRAIIDRDGLFCNLRRPDREQASEFLASADIWFHPMALAHGPDGAIWIVDFYREIIEDYSAIPRYLQQQYGLVNGQDRGRIWRLVHDAMPSPPPASMHQLSPEQLCREIASPYSWRRRTAQRLLTEREPKIDPKMLKTTLRDASDIGTALAAMYTLDALHHWSDADFNEALQHPLVDVRIHALRLADRHLAHNPTLVEPILAIDTDDARLLLQKALSLGYSSDPRVIPALADIARTHADVHWIAVAIQSSLASRAGEMLRELLLQGQEIGKARSMLGPLAAAIAARRDPGEISEVIATLGRTKSDASRAIFLKGIADGFPSAVHLPVADDAKRVLRDFLSSRNADVRANTRQLIARLGVESQAERDERLSAAASKLHDIQESLDTRRAAVEELAAEDDPKITKTLIDTFAGNTPPIQEAILNALMAKANRIPMLVDALQAKTIPTYVLTPVHRLQLSEYPDEAVRQRAQALLIGAKSPRSDLHPQYLAALRADRDTIRGEAVFKEKCANCHQAHGLGTSVGPDLSAEFQRAEETIVRDVLAPSDAIAAGYTTFVVATIDGHVHSGLITSESAQSVTIRQPGGKEQIVLRKQIEEIKALPVSLMPDDLTATVSPEDLANVIAWLRQPSSNITLFDDNASFAQALSQGDGTATFISTDRASGLGSLRVTPLQRHSPSMNGWSFRIREKPAAGEYRYIRFAWKSDGASGIMIELADAGRWPDSQQSRGRYLVGENATHWKATRIDKELPRDWQFVVRDLWKDFGDMTLTGIAPTAMYGAALFDRIELLQEPPTPSRDNAAPSTQ